MACSSRDRELSTLAVDRFHAQLETERYAEVYVEADEEFKKAGSEEELVRLLKSVNEKLGKVRVAHLSGYRVIVNPKGTYVMLSYDTEFTTGRATEQFTWHIMDGVAALLNYNINSPNMVNK